MSNIDSIRYFLPEIILVGFIIIIILADLVGQRAKGKRQRVEGEGQTPTTNVLVRGRRGLSLGLIALGGLVASLVAAAFPPSGAVHSSAPEPIFLGMLSYDNFALLFKFVFLLATAIVVLFSLPLLENSKLFPLFPPNSQLPTPKKHHPGEYYTLILSCTFGMMLMASASDLLMMYLSLEFVSITSYILAGYLRHNRKSAEASLKYIIYGAAASGMMLYGISLLYGISGSTNVVHIGQVLSSRAAEISPLYTLITSVLIMAGFGYKIAAVPFHMWCPDVYEGSPTPITAFFSVGPKAAGFAMLVRFLLGVFKSSGIPQSQLSTSHSFEWQLIIALLAVLTMAVGNLSALRQQNLKRLMAYSSISHAGYLLLAFTIFSVGNVASIMFYVIVYLIMNLGAFLVVLLLEERYGIETVDGCRGFGWRAPYMAGAMAVFLFSLTGLPPFAGFIGKLLLFGYVIESGLFGVGLVVIAVFFSVMSLYYYARIVGAMFLKELGNRNSAPQPTTLNSPLATLYYNLLLWILAGATLYFGLFWGGLWDIAERAARQVMGG